ncbi:MAG: efflux RND transporter permease subunit, partial [Verrucomicrobiales bacterium]
MENAYEGLLHKVLRHPFITIGIGVIVFVLSLGVAAFVPKTFLPPQDFGEFAVGLEMPPGTSLAAMSETALKVDEKLKTNPEIEKRILTIGNRDSESNIANFHIVLVDDSKRKINPSQMKDRIREQLKEFAYAQPAVKDVDMVAGGIRPFTLNIVGSDLEELDKVGKGVFEMLKVHPALK